MKDTNNQGKSFQERLAEAEECRKNATISDIIAAKRREADSIEASARGSFKAGEDWDERPFTESDLESALDLAETKRKEADRLEAAHKREKAEWVNANAGLAKLVDIEKVGDCAKLREAAVTVYNVLEKLRPFSLRLGEVRHMREFSHLVCLAKNRLDAALAAPPRNCDVGTAEEQYKRFMNMCNSKDVRQCTECSMRGFTPGCSRDRCFANWAQLPYEEKEGGAE